MFQVFHLYYRISLQKACTSGDEWSLTNTGGSGVGKMVLPSVHTHCTLKSGCFQGIQLTSPLCWPNEGEQHSVHQLWCGSPSGPENGCHWSSTWVVGRTLEHSKDSRPWYAHTFPQLLPEHFQGKRESVSASLKSERKKDNLSS